MANAAARLQAAIITAGVAITGLSIGTEGVAATVAVAPANLQGAAQATINSFDWSAGAQATWENLQARARAIAFLSDTDAADKVLRAAFDVARDENNVLRAWLAAFKVEVAAATTLADLKTRVAGLPPTPARTKAQLITAITARVNDGTVDT